MEIICLNFSFELFNVSLNVLGRKFRNNFGSP